LAIVSAALLSALLVVPRRVEPVWVPPPVIDRIEQRLDAQAEEERRAQARSGLPLAVRSVGEAFRRFAAASFTSTVEPTLQRDQLRRLARSALEQAGVDGLLLLRAVQTQLFVQAMEERSDSEPTPDRTSLGGSMFRLGRKRGWFAPSPTAARRDELEELFRIYWADALGLHAPPFAPTLNEWRVYYRFLLAQPLPPGPEREQDMALQQGICSALPRHVVVSPAHLARGVLLFQRGAVAEAATEFLAHLQQHPDGPWALRAKNYLAACGAALSD
jgi:hypothetical protein